MKRRTSRKGFSLIELMVVVAIVAIIVALALPSYTRYVLKANRGEAQQLLLNWANNQEIWRANDTNYATTGEIAVPDPVGDDDRYTFYRRVTGDACENDDSDSATEYVLVACANGDQANDEERTIPCTPLTLDQSNAKTPAVCW